MRHVVFREVNSIVRRPNDSIPKMSLEVPAVQQRHEVSFPKRTRQAYYEQNVDFDALARNDTAWAKISTAAKYNGHLDFQDPDVVQYV